MPFLGKDWRSPGWRWIKTEDGWKHFEFFGTDNKESQQENLDKEDEESLVTENACKVSTKKRRKDCINKSAKSEFMYKERWIYVQKESTRERHGYCTIGEAFNRLDFTNAIQDVRRFNYVVKLVHLIAKSQLTSLSGAAQKNYFHVLDKIVNKALEDHQNPRMIKTLLQDLSSVLGNLICEVGKCVLVGSIDIWLYRLETIHNWQKQLDNLQMPKQISNGVTLSDLPLHMLNSILYKFSDARDIISLGQATPTLHMLSEDGLLWKRLCQFHFTENQQLCRHSMVSDKGQVDWKLKFFTLQKYYPKKEQYGDTLHFCRHCSILFWKDRHVALLLKDTGHPCMADDPDSCLTPILPQNFIDLFKF